MKTSLERKDLEKQVKDDKDYTSLKIGELARFVSYGEIALAFSVLTSTSTFSINFVKEYGSFILLASALSIFSILFDYFQYLSGYIDSSKVSRKENFLYSKSSFFYKTRVFCFWAKQFTAIFAAVILVLCIYYSNPWRLT
jgi:hypothetical protein